ncbi:MAG: hypothetical protein WC551_08835 [Patescibacteria group bacterium]
MIMPDDPRVLAVLANLSALRGKSVTARARIWKGPYPTPYDYRDTEWAFWGLAMEQDSCGPMASGYPMVMCCVEKPSWDSAAQRFQRREFFDDIVEFQTLESISALANK